ncbi:hypothetical protein QBC47DRAFT_411926 [Echria macrotheca]|uniref:Uncharacterized protein n=1 Tax=Echria macrotheca TaxID=438768 RepID=A0AAJ0BGI3_9PEZI|nr:hypothetical protein QBC47DRAFT_411926 [Echria macrotheca]
MGLVQYDSSDEDEEVVVEEELPQPVTRRTTLPNLREPFEPPHFAPPRTASPTDPEPSTPPPQPSEPQHLRPIQGPLLGPAAPPPTTATTNPTTIPSSEQDQQEEIDLSFLSQPPDPETTPRSPYTQSRALSRDLTLPAVPNMSIPASPSPPSSPTATSHLQSLNAKFETFLRLKRRAAADGEPAPAHFNARLASSSALRNPGLMDKLLGFVGMETDADEEGKVTGQYGTTLSAEVWDPHCFPGWGYRGSLRRERERGLQERRRGMGEAVEFVHASGGGEGGDAGDVPVRGQRRTMFDT